MKNPLLRALRATIALRATRATATLTLALALASASAQTPFVPVTGITGVPSMLNITGTELTAAVTPPNATHKDIAWSVFHDGGTGAEISGSLFTAKTSGTVILTATAKGGGLDGMTAIAGGSSHTAAIRQDGTLWTWGSNRYGQLGTGAPTGIGARDHTPARVGAAADWAAVSAVGFHTVALKKDGTLWTWGRNNYGQLGNGTTTGSTVPVQVAFPVDPAISFDSAGYSIMVPKSGSSTLGMTATAYDTAGQPIPGAAITYSLQAPYPGVSVAAPTGLVTVSSTAQPGTAAVKAEYQGLTATAQLGLAPFDHSTITFPITQDNEYRITLSAFDIASFDSSTYTVVYDPTKLQLLDAAGQAYGAHTTAGAIPGTGITIVSASSGTLELALDKNIPSGRTWSGAITVLKFKALVSGTAVVYVE